MNNLLSKNRKVFKATKTPLALYKPLKILLFMKGKPCHLFIKRPKKDTDGRVTLWGT